MTIKLISIYYCFLGLLLLINTSCRPLFKTNGATNDSLSGEQWQLYGAAQNSPFGLNVVQAWSITKGDPKNVIAVADTDFFLQQPDLQGPADNKCANREYIYQAFGSHNDQHQHGTQVLSTVAACTNNQQALAGVDWYSTALVVDLGGSLATSMAALEWSAGLIPFLNFTKNKNTRPASVINFSRASEGDATDHSLWLSTLDAIGATGTVFVTASGNEHQNASNHFPSSESNAITVGATDIKGQAASFSNWGKAVDVMAPGKDILVLEKSGTSTQNGTSLASPLVAGVVSLMKTVNPHLTIKSTRYILTSTARPMSCDAYCSPEYSSDARNACKKDCCNEKGEQICTAGLVDAYEAVKMAQKGPPLAALVEVYPSEVIQMYGSSASIKLKNVGGKPTKVVFRSTDANWAFVDNAHAPIQELALEAATQTGNTEKTIQLMFKGTALPSTYNFSLEIYEGGAPVGTPSLETIHLKVRTTS